MRRFNVGEFLKGRLGIAIGYALVVLIWGTTWYGVRTQVNGTAPHVAAALRLGLASSIFFGLAALAGQSLRLKPRQLMLVGMQGVCFFGINYIAVYTASQYVTSGVLAVVFSVTVPFNIIADRVMSGTRPRLPTIFATLIGLTGIALVFASELEQALGSRDALRGAALAVVASAVVAVGNVLAARFASIEVGALRLSAFGLAAGTLLILAWGALSGAPWTLNVTPAWLGGFAYLVVVGSVVAFGVYMKILPSIGPVAGAYVVVLSPVVALAISAMLEGLALGVNALAGVVLLLIGNSILVVRKRRTPVAPEAAPQAPIEVAPGPAIEAAAGARGPAIEAAAGAPRRIRGRPGPAPTDRDRRGTDRVETE